ncbi:hypothetical protein [Nocardiopsis aegyptia]|uniref:Uncharacterized protein n=1 Tax=Nocardiopsis aegyptia TaxID=220378 RepID=A0A7Z0J8X5_9ACTN|nr:hypothetical protein [Nocardiopsis aegyptia]NYJ32884.1 hypothetical protein [Nocardiopsis aegyptia]
MLFAYWALAVGLALLTAGVVLIVLRRRAAGTGDTSERPKLERFSWISSIISMVTGLISTLIGLVPLLEEQGDAAPENTAPSQSPPRSGGAPEQERQCRSDWTPMASGMTAYQACTTLSEGGVALTARVQPTDLVTDTVQVTVWVWLMDRNPDLIESGQLDQTRDTATLNRCRVTLSGDEVQECGPFVVQPPHEGVFSTAGSVRENDSELPPGWDNPAFAGTQGPAVRWPEAISED